MSILSLKLSKIKPSLTLLLNQKASQLKKQGINIIPFGVGEPDFDTPDNVKLAAIKGIIDGKTKYTNVDGTIELKTAVQNKFKKENNLDYNLDEIIVSCGGKQVIYNLLMATLNENDEVIIPIPYWVSYPEMVVLSGGIPVFASCDENFKLTPEELESKISNRTKWLMINCPGNPSGVCYTVDELLKLAAVLERHPHVQVMSDDIYEHIMFDNMKFYSLAEAAPQLKSRIFIVNGVSKSYSMTGWRIGYGAGNHEIVKGMSMVQSQSTSNPSSISQVAALEALSGPQDFIKTNANQFQKKRDLALSILAKTDYLKCLSPNGAFYLFVDCRKAIGAKTPKGQVIQNCDDFASFLLEFAEVAVVPGVAFGLEGFFRMSFATSFDNIKQGCEQIVTACDTIKAY
jgi:aspartate aminotransferase